MEQDLLQELDITVTFLLNWDGGANTKVNCIRCVLATDDLQASSLHSVVMLLGRILIRFTSRSCAPQGVWLRARGPREHVGAGPPPCVHAARGDRAGCHQPPPSHTGPGQRCGHSRTSLVGARPSYAERPRHTDEKLSVMVRCLLTRRLLLVCGAQSRTRGAVRRWCSWASCSCTGHRSWGCGRGCWRRGAGRSRPRRQPGTGQRRTVSRWGGLAALQAPLVPWPCFGLSCRAACPTAELSCMDGLLPCSQCCSSWRACRPSWPAPRSSESKPV